MPKFAVIVEIASQNIKVHIISILLDNVVRYIHISYTDF